MSEACSSPNPPRLLDRVRSAIRVRHYRRRTEAAYVHWICRYILVHNKKHLSAMGGEKANAFHSDLASEFDVAASTQGQALAAIPFLRRSRRICSGTATTSGRCRSYLGTRAWRRR